MNSTISLCWNISNTLQFFKTQFSQTNLYKFSETTNQQTIFGDIWVAPPFFWGGDKKHPQKFIRKKTSSNSEVPERRIHLGLRWGADVSLAGRGLWAGQWAGQRSYQNPIIIGVVFLNSAERHEIFFWMFFFECWDFFKLLRLNRTSNVEQQLKLANQWKNFGKKRKVGKFSHLFVVPGGRPFP